MNFEKDNNEKENFDARKRLAELEATGLYVFHGSPFKIESLEPRQAVNIYQEDAEVPHGEPSVAATPFADVAIFRALVNGENIKQEHFSSFGIDIDDKKNESSLHFEVSKEARPVIEGSRGYVYVLGREHFQPFENEKGMEWRSAENVCPVEIIEVVGKDLPVATKFIDDSNK